MIETVSAYNTPLLPSDAGSQLMELAGNLRHMMLSARHWKKIPAYLAGELDLSSLSLAVVGYAVEGQNNIIMSASFPAPISEAVQIEEELESLIQSHANWHFSGISAERSEAECLHVNIPLTSPSGGFVIHRRIDANRMLLFFIQEHNEQTPVDESAKRILDLTADYLAGLFRTFFECEENPRKLGRPFETLTHAEWVVLLALGSTDGEKQLATNLGLTSQSLHSHVKQIYRKCGVGVRSAALQKLDDARFKYHIAGTSTRGSATVSDREGQLSIG